MNGKELQDELDQSGMALGRLAHLSYEISREKGFYPKEADLKALLHDKILHLHEEVSELYGEMRKMPPGEFYLNQAPDPTGKPLGFSAELADVIIMALGVAAFLEVDIEAIVRAKLTHNNTRGFLNDKPVKGR